MTSYTLKARLADLGMLMSQSRPRVSNHNPYLESLFRTFKYCPESPSKGIKSFTTVRDWILKFESAYNKRYLHSCIQLVTSTNRHRNVDDERLAQGKMVYERAKCHNPQRWPGKARNWELIGPVSINLGTLQEVKRNKLAV